MVCDQVLSQVPRTGAAPITTAAQLDQALSRVLGTADAAADLEHRVRYPTVAAENTGPVRPQTQSTPAPVPVPAEGPPVPGELSAAGSVGGLAAGPRDPDEGLARPRPAPRTWLAVLVALVALTLVASLIAVGINNRRDDAASNQTSTATASGAPVAHPFAVVDDFDPEADGGNNEETPNRVADAHDGKPDTAWETLRYIGNARLGGLKPVVGLVVDLGQTVDVGRITLQLKGSPTGVRVLIPAENPDDAGAPAPMATIEDWTAIATNERAGETVTLTPTAVVKTRYVLVYLSSLPNVGGDGYRGGIAEIGVFDR